MPLEPVVVHREIVIDLAPSRVFDAWADPAQIAHWYVERALGDPRHDTTVTWVLGGTDQELEVSMMEPGRQLVLTNVGNDDWKGTTLELVFDSEGVPGSTRLTLDQTTPAESLQDFMPSVDSGWACSLAVLREYLEQHEGVARIQVEAHTAGAVDIAVLTDALGTAEAIADWSGDRPARVLVSAPRGAVIALDGFPGVFTLMGVGGAYVAYNTWGDARLEAVKTKVADLTDRLWTRIGVTV